MFSKVLCTVLLVAFAQPSPLPQQAVSTVSFNGHHNTVHHLHSAPKKVQEIQKNIVTIPAPHKGHLSSGYDISSLHHYTSPIASAVHFAPIEKKLVPVKEVSSLSGLSFGHSGSLGGLNGQSLHVTPVVQVVPSVHGAPAVQAKSHHVEEYAHPKYEFAYGVEDHHTGDIHSHKESRDGDKTVGVYSLHEADGTIRTVKYTVDKHSGFNAVVERTGHATHAQPAKQSIPSHH